MSTAGTAPADSDRRAPGRPRSARADEAIIAAVLDLFVEGHSAEAISVEAIAARAGVGKATIYRRWPNKEAVIVEAVASMKGPVPAVRGESVRDDLVALLARVSQQKDDRAVKIMSCLLSEVQRSSTLQGCYREVVEPRRQMMREVLRRGMRTGELRPDLDVELALNLLAGPVLVHSMMRPDAEPPDEDLATRVVDAVLRGIAGPNAR
ncbi:TetR/AcrR family transcriptional regulator [Planosporangium sp. 12N6]|uniref:TetR/AcrR family transcriptional regulator n=1 Tax=Planosporangium spinosum TaxID=3402278 RepID=UPI003CFB7901